MSQERSIEINEKRVELKKQIRDKEHQLRSLQREIDKLRREDFNLEEEFTGLENNPPIKVTVYDEDYRTVIDTFSTFDPNDSNIMDLKMRESVTVTGYTSIRVGFESDDHHAVYSMDEAPSTRFGGKVKFVMDEEDYWGGEESKAYESEILENPTYMDALMCFHKSMNVTRDHHHYFLEGFHEEQTVNGVTFYKFLAGS